MPLLLLFAAAVGNAHAARSFSPQPVTPKPALTNWSTWGFGLARQDYNPDETVLSPKTVKRLRQSWAFRTGAPIDTQPTVATNVPVTIHRVRTTANLVFVGNEHGDFFAVDAANGIPVWRRQGDNGPHQMLGYRTNACSDLPDNTFGVTSTPVLDRALNTVYVAGGNGRLYALDMSNGLTRPGWPVTITSDPVHEHVWGALTLVGGAVFVPIASDCDIRPFQGRLVKVGVATHKIVASWSPVPSSHSGGGIWSWGGVSVEPGAGRIFTATGNVFGATTEHDYLAEHVVSLNMDLAVVASNFHSQTITDDDYGSTPMLYQARKCQPQLAVMQKQGLLDVYNRASISSGPVQTLQIEGPNRGQFIGGLAYDPIARLVYVAHGYDSPGDTYRHGLVALKVGGSCRLSLAWQQSSPHRGLTSATTVANGVVYYGNGGGKRLFAFNAATGKPLWNSGRSVRGPIFAAPTVVDGALYAGSWDGRLHAYGIGQPVGKRKH